MMRVALFLLITYSASAGLLTEDQVGKRGRCPESLSNVTTVFRAATAGGSFKQYFVPKPDDPKDAVYREELVAEVFYIKQEAIKLTKPLGELLEEFDTDATSEIIALAPYYLIAQDKEGKEWLIEIRRQDDHVTLIPLRALGVEKPLDTIYWSWREDGFYAATSRELRKIMSSSPKE